MGVSVLWNLLKTLRSPGPSIIEIHCWALSRDNFAICCWNLNTTFCALRSGMQWLIEITIGKYVVNFIEKYFKVSEPQSRAEKLESIKSITHCVHVWGQETQIEDSENCSNEDKRRKLQQARAKWGFWIILAAGPTPAGAPHSPTHPPAGPRSWCKSEQNELISSSAPFFFTSIRFVFFSSIFINHFTMCGNFIPVANHFNFLSTKLSKMIHFSAKSASPLYIMSTLQPFMQSQKITTEPDRKKQTLHNLIFRSKVWLLTTPTDGRNSDFRAQPHF